MTAAAGLSGQSRYWLIKQLAVWLSLVVVFSQSFALWQLLVTTMGRTAAEVVPIGISVALALGIAIFVLRGRHEISWGWAGIAIAVFVAGLLSTDSDFPAKRAHLPEYFLLTTVVFLGFRFQLEQGAAILTAVVLGMMLGGIDELIQGAMPTRTFGLPDLLTNSLGALSAGFMIRAMNREARILHEARSLIIPMMSVGFGFGLLLLAVNAHKGLGFPIWVYLPAVASLPMLLLANCWRTGQGNVPRSFQAMGTVSLIAILLVYGIDALDLDFH